MPCSPLPSQRLGSGRIRLKMEVSLCYSGSGSSGILAAPNPSPLPEAPWGRASAACTPASAGRLSPGVFTADGWRWGCGPLTGHRSLACRPAGAWSSGTGCGPQVVAGREFHAVVSHVGSGQAWEWC